MQKREKESENETNKYKCIKRFTYILTTGVHGTAKKTTTIM